MLWYCHFPHNYKTIRLPRTEPFAELTDSLTKRDLQDLLNIFPKVEWNSLEPVFKHLIALPGDVTLHKDSCDQYRITMGDTLICRIDNDY